MTITLPTTDAVSPTALALTDHQWAVLPNVWDGRAYGGCECGAVFARPVDRNHPPATREAWAPYRETLRALMAAHQLDEIAKVTR